jgi:hypothetical protein
MNLYFAVENPSGISAKAMATMLTEALGADARGDRDGLAEIVERLFRQNISMGKAWA